MKCCVSRCDLLSHSVSVFARLLARRARRLEADQVGAQRAVDGRPDVVEGLGVKV